MMLAKPFVSKSSPLVNAALRCFSTSPARLENHRCKLLVVGGGAGGCTVAAKFSKHLKGEELVIVEPSDTHYYQPMFTMVGGGIKKLEDSRKKMEDVLPKSAKWIKKEVVKFDRVHRISRNRHLSEATPPGKHGG